jgi:prolyl-tRNA editing enzyme YbaK/EbsC (Cys-tRNA(Pro) deacylase)
MATENLTRALDEAGVAYELLPHAHTESALAEAQALGLPADDVAKTLIVKTREGYLRAVVPASDRLDERKLRDITDGSKKEVHLASEDELRRDYPDFDLGAVPPVGGARRDPVIVDSRVKARARRSCSRPARTSSPFEWQATISCAQPAPRSQTSARRTRA